MFFLSRSLSTTVDDLELLMYDEQYRQRAIENIQRRVIPFRVGVPLGELELYLDQVTKRQTGSTVTIKEAANERQFNVIVEPKDTCEGQVLLLIYIHTSPEHVERRDIIRRTWGNVSLYLDDSVRRVFVLGQTDNTTLRQQLDVEFRLHEDLLQLDFIDSYFNMTVKAVTSLRWISSRCHHSRFVLKTDDDAFVNMFSLLEILSSKQIFNEHGSERTLMCNWWTGHEVQVAREGKWNIHVNHWRYRDWPPFCQGLAFVMSTDLVIDLYRASFQVPVIRLDDLFLTGLIPLGLSNDLNIVKLNSRYVDANDLKYSFNGQDWKWYLFSHLRGQVEVANEVWSYLVQLERGNVRPLKRSLWEFFVWYLAGS